MIESALMFYGVAAIAGVLYLVFVQYICEYVYMFLNALSADSQRNHHYKHKGFDEGQSAEQKYDQLLLSHFGTHFFKNKCYACLRPVF